MAKVYNTTVYSVQHRIMSISNFAYARIKDLTKLLWFYITSLSDWFKVLAPLFQPIRSKTKTKTKTNRGSRVHIFPRFVSAACNYFEF